MNYIAPNQDGGAHVLRIKKLNLHFAYKISLPPLAICLNRVFKL